MARSRIIRSLADGALVRAAAIPLALSSTALGGAACGQAPAGSTFGDFSQVSPGADDVDGGVDNGDPGGSMGRIYVDASVGTNVQGDDGGGNGAGPGCASLRGTVTTPGQTDPLYNAIVYVAKGAIDPITDGATCERCGPLSSAKAVAATLTGADGTFLLKGVPLGPNVPLVVELGKWRRVVPINVTTCGDVSLPADLTRLPRNQTEGNIPLTAISTGLADSIECILRKMGISDSEFTTPTGGGRIHMYRATGAGAPDAVTPDQSQLWSDLATLTKYDVVLLPCEGGANTDGKEQGYQNLVDYAAAGGRVFTTHYGYTWIRSPSSSFAPTAHWTDETKYFGDGYDFPVVANVDMTFPKGRDFATWLVNVGASSVLGTTVLDHIARNADAVLPDVAQSWLASEAIPRQYSNDGSVVTQQILHHYTFNTPVGASPANQCGRVVYSGFHVNDASSGDATFPAECDAKPLTPQEKVLMFMLFDLASCVQTDREPPLAPIIN